jgi:hypothetical protein
MYMIKLYTNDAFEHIGEPELNLRGNADALSLCVRDVLAHFATTGSLNSIGFELATTIHIHISQFVHDYRNWKDANRMVLIRRLTHTLFALMCNEAQLPAGDSPLRRELVAEILQVRTRLLQVSGSNGPDLMTRLTRLVEQETGGSQV